MEEYLREARKCVHVLNAQLAEQAAAIKRIASVVHPRLVEKLEENHQACFKSASDMLVAITLAGVSGKGQKVIDVEFAKQALNDAAKTLDELTTVVNTSDFVGYTGRARQRMIDALYTLENQLLDAQHGLGDDE